MSLYTAPSIDAAEDAFEQFAATWEGQYPAMVGMWRRSWDPQQGVSGALWRKHPVARCVMNRAALSHGQVRRMCIACLSSC